MSTHTFADQRLVSWLNRNHYHPRSNKHGAVLCDYFLDDLLYSSSKIARLAKQGQVVYDVDVRIGKDPLSWTVDLVMGPPKQQVLGSHPISKGEPDELWLAIDAKSVMTKHSGSRRNRQRDLASLANIVKGYHPKSVVGGLMMVNIAPTFKSPLRNEVTIHKHISKLVDGTIQMFNQIPRAPVSGGSGIEAVGVVVLNHDNINLGSTTLHSSAPSPPSNSRGNYRYALKKIVDSLEARFP